MDYICLKNNLGFKWKKNDGIYAKGYLFDKNNSLKKNMGLINYFLNYDTEQGFRNLLFDANGFFAVVIETENYILASVDKVRSIPLFYGHVNNKFYLSDDARFIKEKVKDVEMDKLAETEFLLTGYVTNNYTLYPNVKQLRAGEYLVYDKLNNKLKLERYFEFRHGNYFELSEEQLIEELDKVHIRMTKRLIESLEGRTAVIPLSGGYDSRLIALMIKRLGYNNVICFTYGRKGNWESEISKEIAEYLGYKWIFIPYTKENQSEMYSSCMRKEYSIFADGLTSLPHIQDFYAVWKMKEDKLIPKNSIFIPGHTGDFIEGGHIPHWFIDKAEIDIIEIIDSIFKKHYRLWNWFKQSDDLYEKFSRKIIDIIGSVDVCNQEEASDLFELWEWQERQAKYIVNSVRVYEYFGYQWRLPLWDNKIMDFWSRITVNLRINRRLYYKYANIKLDNNLPEPNPNRGKTNRALDRLYNPYYGWFLKNTSLLPLFNIKVKDVLNIQDKDFIQGNQLAIISNINSLAALSHMNLLYEK